MRIALISVAYPPLCSSGAVQIRDLATEFVRQGHQIFVFYPDSVISAPYVFENDEGIEVLRLRTGKTREISYIQRTLNEFLMPYFMWWRFKRLPYCNLEFDGIVWYSPSIFFAPLVYRLKKKNQCKSYLILRDIFPEWVVDTGLLSHGLAYNFFKYIAHAQYNMANVIGVQTKGNLDILADWQVDGYRKIEVLHNWLAPMKDEGCSMSLTRTPLAERKICVYAGNMGVAQGVNILIDLAESLTDRTDIGFLFVGRGSEVDDIRTKIDSLKLNNVLLYDEIPAEEIPGLYAQCHIGLIALDRRHKSHNIPGKFLSYMQNGLPVLAAVNPGNDLIDLINDEKVGYATSNFSIKSIRDLTLMLLDEMKFDIEISVRCKFLATKMFIPEIAVKQIINGLK